MNRLVQLAETLLELIRVLAVLPNVEAARRSLGIKPLVGRLRSRSRGLPRRTPFARLNLRRAIAWVDSLMPGGPNCYRRVLLEVALDQGAASESVFMGFNYQDDKLAGHVWLSERSESSKPYQVMVRL